MRVLVVDDEEDVRVALELELKAEGFEVLTADNGYEGLKCLQRQVVDIVISDILMPKMDGFELCRQMKLNAALKTIPLIFYTATYVDKRDEQLAIDLGASGFLLKPTVGKALINAIQSAIERESPQPTTSSEEQLRVIEKHRDAVARKLEEKIREIDAEREALRISEAKYRRLVESLESDYIMYSRNISGVFTYVSPSIRMVLGCEPEDFLDHYTKHMTNSPLNREVAGHIEAVLAGNRRSAYEVEMYHKDGSIRVLEISEQPIKNDLEEVIAIEGIAHDITEQKQSREAITKLAHQNTLILKSAAEGIFGINKAGEHTFVNPAAARMLGYRADELIGLPTHVTWHYNHSDGSHYSEKDCPILSNLGTARAYSGEEWFIRKDGKGFPVQFNSSPIIEGGEITGAVITFSDISDKKEAEAQINHLAYFDVLTELPNRTLFMERVSQTLAMDHRYNHKSAMLLLNIDRFKNINDARGYSLGDLLLQAVSARLQELMSESDTLARLGSDEFAILIVELGKGYKRSSYQAHILAEKILDALRSSFLINEEAISVSVSIGLTIFPDANDENALDILRRANTALHRVKEKGGNQSAFFDRNMGDSVERRYQIERELRQAIKNNELRLFLQPQMDPQKRLAGFEVLVRWQHPEHGLLPPGIFIPIAEESDLIIDVGVWVLKEALKMMMQGDMAGHPFRLSVNLSPRHFRQSSFTVWLKDLLSSAGADPNHLTLEVTESLVVENVNEVISKMSELSALGIHFSIDDFGTGYSSLAYLKRLPVHELKIDKSFIQDAPTDEGDAALVKTILVVAEQMHLNVVAEGVETVEQAEFLNKHAKVVQQGYYHGKPELAKVWLEHWFGSDFIT
ncbi:MAG: EAL domain-containing protein [Candidatus Thiodiazotropha sp. (ex Dulcina madagascariensis)]|nr:EAL domain-containing protein [Candidatus Thiodiazotropha sp. (ex Dulcina madagascariensis)]MCU7925957.1 EAL domain-containing protein [Candidatus Thiodiazotropha sp. (ex Dulcina madagascariensis)]